MREVHGLAGVLRVDATHPSKTDVLVFDGRDGLVVLQTGSVGNAGMTLVEARFLAKQLIAAADRVERRRALSAVPEPEPEAEAENQ